MGRLDGKIAIVTGGTKGIGLATVEKMAQEGAIVYACARHQKDFNNPNIIYHGLDVTSNESCKELYNDVINKHSIIDILVANAGITRDALTVKMTDDDFDSVINTNLKGIFNLIRYFGPHMEKQGFGSIVLTSSIIGEQGNIGQVNYAASKAGLIGMTKSWAKEFSRKGAQVRVNAIAPGFINTDMLSTVPQDLLKVFETKTALNRLGKPEEVANVIAFLSSNEASFITGSVIDVNGGMNL